MELYDNIKDAISSVGMNGMNIHEEIQKAALMSANKGSHFDAIWHGLLERLLQHWEADVQMDLWEATNLMLRSAGYFYESDWHDIHPSMNYELWYKYEEDSLSLLTGLIWNRKDVVYKMTIAVFETINYWCWHESLLNITFNREELKRTLRYGSICIDWNSYQYQGN